MSTFVTPALALLLVLAWARPLALDGLRALHILQLEEYQSRRYWHWIAENTQVTLDVFLVASAGLAALALALLPFPVAAILPIAGIGVGIWQSWTRKQPEAKKPLVLTARAKRLLGGWILVLAVVLAAAVLGFGLERIGLALATALFAVGLLSWPLMSIANLLLYPVEAGFRAYYLRSARQILTHYKPTVIGVAGSYGKTSTKTILAQILNTRSPTLATPRSFNTPMGLCRVIREQLEPTHRFFVAEMGAYQRGEIKQLCKLCQPSIGILTTVGPEHLERFGSMANVVEAEFEIISSLPKDGLAIVNGYDETCRELARRALCPVQIVGGDEVGESILWAEDVGLTSAGLRFTICHRDGRRTEATTGLLGRHNVANILLASAAALACGLPFDDLPGVIAALESVEHRLQLVPNGNGVVVIDDTYNSNPRGAQAALETLGSFAGGRRYLVTPGMVELAEMQDVAHRDFGEQAAKVCDAVILIGPKRTQAIADGLTAAGFSRDRLIVTRSLAEATEQLRGLLRQGDAVLFENDLPDNYLE